jgi:hypothetical protein
MYIKPSKTYRMSALLKTSLATASFKDAHHRGEWKRAMIQAELAAAIIPKSIKTDRGAPRGTSSYVTNDTGTASTQSE